MKHLKTLALLALVAAFAAPAFAETQTVKVSGALDVYHFYRKNYDMRDNNDAGAIPATAGVAVPAEGGAATAVNQSDGDDFFMSIAQVEVAADLTDNVSVVIRLLNQRDWNADAFEVSSNGDVARGAENREEEFDVGVDLAYLQLKEAFYAPLTLTIGRQDLWFGRGFIIGANYQDPNNSIQANEFTAVVSFDAIRATLDFAPWTIDGVFAAIDENSHDPENDRAFWFLNVNYQFCDYNAEWEGYFMADLDKATLSGAASGAAGTENTPRTAEGNETYTIGTRGQFDPIPNLTLGGEVAWQFGDYSATSGPASSRDRSALGIELFGEYRFENQWKPLLGAQYVHFSGDGGVAGTTDYEAWNDLFRGPTYGDIRDWQEVFYRTALATDQPAGTNQQHIAIYGSLLPMEDLKLEIWAYHFWTDEDIVSGVTTLNDDIGNEVDVHTTYNYTEDVTFGLWLAWFFPGDLFNNQVGGGTPGETDASVFQSVSSVKVVF